MRPLNRVTPRVPVQAMQSYEIAAPAGTHWRPATSCAEVECGAHLHGWRSVFDESTELGRQQADYVRRQSGRAYREERDERGLTVFTFEAGQNCFALGKHQVRTGRPELYVVRGGDWRANTGVIRRHTRPEDWVEDFAEHQDRIATAIEQG